MSQYLLISCLCDTNIRIVKGIWWRSASFEYGLKFTLPDITIIIQSLFLSYFKYICLLRFIASYRNVCWSIVIHLFQMPLLFSMHGMNTLRVTRNGKGCFVQHTVLINMEIRTEALSNCIVYESTTPIEMYYGFLINQVNKLSRSWSLRARIAINKIV